MFKRTYGTIYEQNAYVFSDLFTELEFYYARGKVDLAEAMDSFFNTLYQKMFTVLNSQYAFDDKWVFYDNLNGLTQGPSVKSYFWSIY
jgi:glypican 4